MRHLLLVLTTLTILAFTLPVNVAAQEEGDYRSAAKGDWSAAATWEVYQAGSWVAATSAPTGSETITVVGDTVWVDVAQSITGTVVVEGTGVLAVSDGTLTFDDGGIYEHARDGGSVPEATWEEGSTARFTGIELDAPEDRGQDYHHLVINTPGHIGNKDLDLGGRTISGDLRVIDTGDSRWRLIGGEDGTITIMGDVIVEEDAALETLGSSSPVDIDVNHYGDVEVNGGTFAVSRGSQGNGTGTVDWHLFEGDFSITDGELRNSNPEPGNAQLVFASADTQRVTFENVEFGGGDFHYRVSDSSAVEVSDGFEVNGLLANEGYVEALGEMTFIDDGGIYEHARNGGSVPTATWEEGSTARFTGIAEDAPENRGQDYYNLVLDTPDMIGNKDLDLGGNTISGDIHAIHSGISRWRLIGGENATITVMGDIVVEEDANLETLGTGDPVDVVVNHYGSIDVDGGNFSVGRGSQGNGTGTTLWYLFEGDITMTDAETKNSNPTPGNARFIFASDTTQHLAVEGEMEDIENLSVEVSDSTTLDLGSTMLAGSGVFWLNAGGAIATELPGGVAEIFADVTGEVSLEDNSSYEFDGAEAQITSEMMPTVVSDLVIDNEASVELSQETTINGVLRLVAGVFDNTIPFTLGPDAEISREGGSLAESVATEPREEIPTEFALHQNYPNPFNPSTVIKYNVKQASDVTITIHDVMGRQVAQLVSTNHSPGSYEVEWNAGDEASGVYYYRIRAGEWSDTRSMLLVR